jgi:hypothetical protein
MIFEEILNCSVVSSAIFLIKEGQNKSWFFCFRIFTSLYLLNINLKFIKMKKIYSLLAAVLITSVSFAQSKAKNYVVHPSQKVSFDKSNYSKTKNKIYKTATVQSSWFSTAIAADNLHSNIGVLSVYPFFPDTMGLFTFSNGDFATFVHSLGEIVDPKAVPFLADPLTDFIWSPTPQAYSVDSMSIQYTYSRHNPNVNITDTLIISIANNNTAANLAGGYFTTTSYPTVVADYNTDTLQLHLEKYTMATQMLNATGAMTFKILLTSADTSANSLAEKLIALPSVFNIPVNKVLIASVKFKPGYTYTLGDVISNMGNVFRFASLEENGVGTYPLYYDCNAGSVAAKNACDFSTSSIVSTSERYNLSTSFGPYYVPSYAFAIGYGFEHHLLSFKLSTGVATSVSEIEKNGFALGQNTPNPFISGSTVNYHLTKDANAAIFMVTDITGRIISSEKVSTSTGTHSVNLGSYAAGVYYYSLNVDGIVTTKKMIAQ